MESIKKELQTKMAGKLLWNIDNRDFNKVLYGDNIFLLMGKSVETISTDVNMISNDEMQTITIFKYQNIFILVECSHTFCGSTDSNIRLSENIIHMSKENKKIFSIKHLKKQMQQMKFFESLEQAKKCSEYKLSLRTFEYTIAKMDEQVEKNITKFDYDVDFPILSQ